MKNEELNIVGKGDKSIATRRDGKKYLLEWRESVDFSDLKNIRQVYGFLFNDLGELLIVNPNSSWRLPGGRPEKCDGSFEETLRREAMEEADVEISNLIPCGYIKVSSLDKKSDESVHYLLRYVGIISKVNKQTIDEAIGEINERRFIDPKKFSDYIDWGELGLKILNCAMELNK